MIHDLASISSSCYAIYRLSTNAVSIISYTQLFISSQDGDILRTMYIYHSLHTRINNKILFVLQTVTFVLSHAFS
jgi:hypothetical protein